jgi:hypothetical protein
VEAVATDIVLLEVLGGDGVAVSLSGHGHVESGVEHSHVGSAGHSFLAGTDAQQVGGNVQGAQGGALFDGGDDSIIDDSEKTEQRAMAEFNAGLIDQVEYFAMTRFAGNRELAKKFVAEMVATDTMKQVDTMIGMGNF